MEIQKNQGSRELKTHSQKGSEDKALDLFYSNKQILTHYGESLTISDAIHSPSIRKLLQAHGDDYMVVFITGLLHEFLSFVPNSITGDEVVLYADKILAHCPTWSTADLVLCLKNGMDGKYGPIKFRWTWATDFVEWAKKYDQQKVEYFFNKHVEKTNNGKMADQDLIKLLPKELIEKFAKEKFVNQEKRKRLDIKVPKEVVDRGLAAVDEWIKENIK